MVSCITREFWIIAPLISSGGINCRISEKPVPIFSFQPMVYPVNPAQIIPEFSVCKALPLYQNSFTELIKPLLI